MPKNEFRRQQFEIIKEKFGEYLSQKGLALSQNNIAKELGVSKGKVQAWEKGQRPSSDDLEKISRLLGLNPGWLLLGKVVHEEQSQVQKEVQNLRPHAPSEPDLQVCPSCSSQFAGYIVNVHSTIGAGPAMEHWEPEPLFQVCIPERFYWQNLLVIQVEGSSMEPLIRKGAFVGLDTGQTWIVAGEIYGVRVPYEGLTLKRVFVDPQQDCLRLQSENSRHPEQQLPIEGREGLVVGKAVWVMQEI